MITTVNPTNLKKIQEYQTLDDFQLKEKLDHAVKAYQSWCKTNLDHRAKLLKNLSAVLEKNEDKSARLMTLEMGKPIVQAKAEIKKCIWLCDYYQEHAAGFLGEQLIETEAKKSMVVYEPLGVILGIMPWNFPFWQVLRFVVPTLMAGNTVVIKHAPGTMGCANLIESLFKTAGFDSGVYTNLIINVDQVDQVICHQGIQAVSLTGSETAGAAVASMAGSQIKKSVLELGGSNALIICEDADLKKVLDIAVNGRMQNNGQSCIAVKKILVHQSLQDLFVTNYKERITALIVGDPMDETTDLGPLAREELAIHLENQVDDTIMAGADFILKGHRRGAFFYPSILSNVVPGMRAFDEELFGPVVTLSTFEHFEEAIALSNATNFGLGVTICTKSVNKVIERLDQFEQGAVFINEMVKSDPRLPFGGVKKSGYGRELGLEGIRAFVNVKTVYID